ncbi:MAG: hypothetical protein ABI346_09420, partial [Candidatus Baltobacteraceae bacterium]
APPLGNGPLASRLAKPGMPRQIMDALYPSRTRHGPPPSANRGPGWLSAQAKTGSGLLYVGDFDTSVVNIYNRRGINPAQVGQITTGISNPERLFVDANGALYVTDNGTASVTVYPKGSISPSLTITTGISDPTGLTVDAAGTVYVTNVGNGTITEYPAGATSPSLTIPDTGSENLATDSHENLYSSGFYGNSSGVEVYAPGSTTGTNLGISVGDATGIEVDRNGDIALEDLAANMLDLYHAGQTQPYRQVALSGLPFELAMNKKQGQLYASVLVGSGFAIQRVGYPNGNATAKLDNAGSSGWPLAVSPDNVQ